MPEIRAIPTAYAGCKFRSRAEARWAVFFDAMDLKWEYEPEGYVLSSGPYLPDFFLPEVKEGTFVEVKGAKPTREEESKARDLSAVTGRRVVILVRAPVLPDGRCDGGSMMFYPNACEDWDYWFCECAICGCVGIEYSGRSGRLGCDCHDGDDKAYNWDSPRLLAAYEAARSARFGT